MRLFLVFLLFGFYSPLLIASENPNIILILTDDQGWGATSVQMHKDIPESKSDFIKTPNLEALAQDGVKFSQGYAPHVNCSPSRYSILTGKSPAKLKATDITGRFNNQNGKYYKGNLLNPPTGVCSLKEEDITITQWIKQHRPNYSTAHFGKWHIGGKPPESFGFDMSDGKTGNKEGNNHEKDDPKRVYSITNKAISWIQDQHSNQKPFYLQLSHYATHLKIRHTEKTFQQYESSPKGERHTHSGHAAMTEELDNSVGILIQELKHLKIYDNTYIIYLADNGSFPLDNPGNTNGPLHGWKATVWEGGIRVPFIIKGPGIKPNQQCNTAVVGYDLFPTISSWLNIDTLPPGLEGGDLGPALSNHNLENIKREHDFLVFHWPHYQLQKGSQPSTALIKGKHKLIKYYESDSLHLFNLENDLAETNNLTSQNPELTQQLHKEMTNYLKSIQADMPKVNQAYSKNSDLGLPYTHTKKRLLNKSYFILTE